MKQELSGGVRPIFDSFGSALRHSANLTGCPLFRDSVALSASNWAFNPSSSEGLGGIPFVMASTKASRAW
jgi:hypothetical protein